MAGHTKWVNLSAKINLWKVGEYIKENRVETDRKSEDEFRRGYAYALDDIALELQWWAENKHGDAFDIIKWRKLTGLEVIEPEHEDTQRS